MDPNELSLEDQRMLHTTLEHLAFGAMIEMVTAEAEAKKMERDGDERATALIAAIASAMDALTEAIDNIYDTIPGIKSREEAEQEAEEFLTGLEAVMMARQRGQGPDTPFLN